MKASTSLLLPVLFFVCSVSVQAFSFDDLGKKMSNSWSDVEKAVSDTWSEVEQIPFWTDLQREAHKVEEAGKHVWNDLGHIADSALKDAKVFAFNFAADYQRLQKPMADVFSKTDALQASLVSAGVSIPDVTGALSVVFDDIVRELERMFPPPSEALGHDERQAMWDHAMSKLGDATVALLVDKFHLPAKETRDQWDAISAAIGSVLITVADLAEQHPHIATALFGLMLAEALAPRIGRLLLDLLGFGRLGPVKGSLAAWAQRVFFGGHVEANNVFAILQKAGMVL